MMFPDAPRIFALPPGARFPEALARGLAARARDMPPEGIARIELLVNARRSAALVERALAEALGPDALLPRIRVVTDLADRPGAPVLPQSVPPLRRLLRLSELVRAFLAARPDIAPEAARFDLARALAGLMDELHEAGIAPGEVAALDPGGHAAHWEATSAFLRIVAQAWPAILAEEEAGALDPQTRQREALEGLAARWAAEPPSHPVIVAGSTASRPLTAGLMAAVAGLPQGALVLPGYDAHLPRAAWAALSPDHPQATIGALLDRLGVEPGAVRPWTDAPDPPPARLVSLSLHPAPVTDAWRAAAPALAPGLPAATGALSLIEAAAPREEALAIALALRETLETPGRTAALVTPDRALVRQVTSALDRWGIVPDDAAGRPLGLTPPGIFLRLVAGLGRGVTPERLIATLKHPLAGGVGDWRRVHMLMVSRLEDALRATPMPAIGPGWHLGLKGWAAAEAALWAGWLDAVLALIRPGEIPLAAREAALRAMAERLSAGPGEDRPRLWDREDGRAARELLDALRDAAGTGTRLGGTELAHLLDAEMETVNVPPSDPARAVEPRLRIIGNREARLETADRVILGGLSEGVWPALPGADPWLSRPMRAALGLSAPERRIGLAAHDFQTAAGGAEVILTRPRRREGAPALPARWLIRLTNLMTGCGAEGEGALAAMRARGDGWLRLARALDRPAGHVEPEARPEPRPPVGVRPRRLSVTRVETLIRDPYAIYAENVLRLKRLDPPGRPPDARDRGTILHRVLQRFVEATLDGLPPEAGALFDRLAAEEIDRATPWPAERRLWRGRMARAAAWFVDGEAERRQAGRPVALERKGEVTLDLPGGPFRLTAKADRIDRMEDGTVEILDYKTGSPPGPAQIRAFQRQMPLQAVIAEEGGFEGLAAARVVRLTWLGVSGAGPGGTARHMRRAGDDPDKGFDPARERSRLAELLAAYDDADTPYTARLMPAFLSEEGEYDHLARLGEWEAGEAEEAE